MSGSFCKELLTFEPVRMVNLTQPFMQTGPNTLELSNSDHLYGYFNAVALFFDASVGIPHQDKDNVQPGNLNKDSSAQSVKDPETKLHDALRELLVHYPPAAGRIHFNDSNGRYEVKYMPTFSSSATLSDNEDSPYGVPFIVAHADTSLSELGDVSAPHPSLDLLYPSILKQNQNNEENLPLAIVQVTTFTCGSFALAVLMSHMLWDGYGAAIWLRNLCSFAKGEGLAAPMDMTNRRELVKPRVPLSPKPGYLHLCTWKRGETHVNKELSYGAATKFSFSLQALDSLRSRASDPHTKPCSRFQALVAFLWITKAKCLAKSGSSPDFELPIRFPMNLRQRTNFPTFTQAYMGNAILQCIVIGTVQELCESTLANVVRKIQSSIVQHSTQEYIQSEIDYIELQLQNGIVPYVDHSFLAIPCLVGLPFYDADCGWGRPIYCARPSQQLGNRIIILDVPRSKAWNVLVVLSSQQEHDVFVGEITLTSPLDEGLTLAR